MHIVTDPPPHLTMPDAPLTFDYLERRTEAFGMSSDQLHTIWMVVTGIGHAIKPDDPKHSSLIDQNVLEFGRDLSCEGVPLILFGDFERIFTRQELIDEMKRLFPVLLDEAALLNSWRFINRMRNRD